MICFDQYHGQIGGETCNIGTKMIRSNSHFRVILEISTNVDEMQGIKFKIVVS